MPAKTAASRAKGKHPGLYSVHPGVQMVRDWIDSLPEKTGRSLDQWLTHIRKNGPADEKSRRDWLKGEHGLGTNSCWWLAEKATRPGAIEDDTPAGYLKIAPSYVDDQYAGKKAALRPIYDGLLRFGLALGKDAKACPCKTMVPLYREHVFAQIAPTTNSRVDLGLALGKLPEGKIPTAAGRIVATGGREKKDRITHRIPIAGVGEMDALVKRWLARAYELDT